MKAIGLTRYLPIADSESLKDVILPRPNPKPRDLIVEVRAVSVNPVDTKVRAPKPQNEDPPRVLGWDASGVVVEKGSAVSLFELGESVYYSGDLTRSGSYAQYQAVDERIVGRHPSNLSYAEAAALPLTTITAYESLFTRLNIDSHGRHAGQTLLVIGGAGGVGSVAIQLAKVLGDLVVITTASRPETINWVRSLGADHVINHRQPLVPQIRELGLDVVDHIAIFNDMRHWDAAVELIRPQGGIVAIDNTDLPMPMAGMKTKSAALHWEFMFARSMHETPDMIEQHHLLNRVAGLVEEGKVRTTLTENLTGLTAANLRRAHEMVESGTMIGKVVVSNWPA